MALALEDLDDRTRRFMVEELDRDLAAGSLYISTRLADEAAAEYPDLLRSAMQSGDDETLASELRRHGRLLEREPRKTPSGGWTTAKVPTTAAETLAEGEFNRFYL